MSIDKNYRQARKDYEYLIEHHKADIHDITGGYVEGEHYKELLEDPSVENATSHYIHMIDYSSYSGFENDKGNRGNMPDLKDKKTLAIYKRYKCNLSSWG